MEMILVTENEKKTIEAMETGTIEIGGYKYYVWHGELYMGYTSDGYEEQVDLEVAPKNNVHSEVLHSSEQPAVSKPFYLRDVSIDQEMSIPTDVLFSDNRGGPLCSISHCASYTDDEKVELAERIALAMTLIKGINNEQLRTMLQSKRSMPELFKHAFATKVKGEPICMRMKSDSGAGGSGMLPDGRSYLNMSYMPGAQKRIVDGVQYDVIVIPAGEGESFVIDEYLKNGKDND